MWTLERASNLVQLFVISFWVETKRREGPADGCVVCQHEAGHSVGWRDVGGGARESNLSSMNREDCQCSVESHEVPTWIDAGPHGMKFASFLSLILWRLLCTWVHNHKRFKGWHDVEADLGGVDLPLDDVEDGDVAVLVCSAQVLLNTSAYLAHNNLHSFCVKSLPSYSLAAAVASWHQEQWSCAHWQNLGLKSTGWSQSSRSEAWKYRNFT